MPITIIQSFLPWILFSLCSSHLYFAISIAALSSILLEMNELKKGYILSWGTLIYFVLIFVTVIIFKMDWITKYLFISSNLALVIIAWGSILLRKPFTIQYARNHVTADKWHHPIFIKINYILSFMWGLAFAISVLINLYQLHHNTVVLEISTYIPTLFAISITAWFPNWYRSKYGIYKSNK